MDYQELIRLSTKGDSQALEDLFDLAEKLSAEKKHEEASKAFQDSAISYRISAARNMGLARSAESRANWLNEEIQLINRWIEANPSGLRPLPRVVEGMNAEFILEVLRDKIWRDSQFSYLIPHIESALEKFGMEFYSPGGSSLRRVIALMGDYFGLKPSPWAILLDHLEVRIGMDLLADEVEKRFFTSDDCNVIGNTEQ